MSDRFFVPAVVLALLIGAMPAWAQIDLDKTTLSGTVRDESGGVLVGATVSLSNPATGAIRTATTDDGGGYRLAALAPGTYQLRVELDGFAAKLFPEVPLTVGQRAGLDVVLTIARAQADVVVFAKASLIETTRVAQASTLSQNEIERLPINRRNFLDFALLTPGATAANPLAPPSPTNSPSSNLSIAGQDQRSNSVTIDGADNMDTGVNSVRSTLSQDAVQEFQVLRSSFSAEFGRARGGVVNIVSKSGTNDTHGGGFLYVRDDALDARNAFAFDTEGQPADPPFQRQQFGGTLGGPFIRDRAFFFGSYEGLRRRESAFVSVLQSDEILHATASQQHLFGALAASGNPQLAQISALFIDPSRGLLNTTPATFPGTLDLLEQESGVFPFAADSHTASLRLDGNLSPRSQLMVRVNFTDARDEGNDVGGLRTVSSGNNSRNRNLAAVASSTRVLSDRSVNVLRGQYGRFHTATLPSDPAGPGLIIAGVAQIGRDLYNPTEYTWNIFQAGDTWLQSRGRHELKVGGDLLHMRSRDARAEVFLAGQFQFAEAIPLAAVLDTVVGSGTTALIGSQRPDLLPDLLAPITSLQSYNFGLPVVYLQGFGDPTTDITYTQLAGFVQDEVRIGEDATLSLGVRYDTEWRDASVTVAETPPPFTLASAAIRDRNNVAPRIGLAYTPGSTHRTVLRAGWGVFYQSSLQATGFSSRVLSGQISQVFLPLTGLPGVPGTSADVWRQQVRDGHVDADTLKALGIVPGTTPSVLLAGREQTPDAVSSQASAGIEHEWTTDLSAAAEYAYVRGRNIIRLRDINVREVGANQFALPGVDPRFLQLNVFEPAGRSSYHGLSLSVRKRYSRNWALLGSYTLARAMDDVTDFTLETEAQDQTDLAAEWGRSSYEQRHRIVVSSVFTPSSGMSWLSGWSVAPIVTYASGRPFNLMLGYDGNGDAHPETDRARLAGGASAGRNTGTGPAYLTADIRLAKQVTTAAGPRLEFTFEAFNLFNRTNYSGVNRVLGNQVLASEDVTGRSDLPPTQPLGFTSAYPARQLQLGIRLLF